jgi:O-antigen ligase
VYVLLSLLIVILTTSDVLSLDISLGPGLSLKNALLNVLAIMLLVRIVLSGKFRIEIPAIVISFGVTFLYAALSILIASLIIQYPHYSTLGSIVALKTAIVDQTLLMLTFFYGITSVAEGFLVLRVLLVCVTLANVLTITNVYGLTDVGHLVFGDNNDFEANRVYGFFGHANETGTMIAVMLPGYVAMASYDKGLLRLLWVAGMFLSIVVLIMTGSRGALAGIGVGTVWGLFLCRKDFSAKRLLGAAVPYAVVGVPLVVLLAAQFGSEFLARFINLASSADVSEVSSGRTMLWAQALGRMMETPLSLITGFGWNVYDSMGFILVPHNHYLMLWFELGLVGLGGFLIISNRIIATFIGAINRSLPGDRDIYIAGIFSLLILLVGVFFVQLYRPWLYIWPYLAVTLRMAVIARAIPPKPGAVVV